MIVYVFIIVAIVFAVAFGAIRTFICPVKTFSINQFGGNMAITQAPLLGIALGATGTFSATPLDSTGNIATVPAGLVPVWISSNPDMAPVTATGDGLSATVTVSSTAIAGTVINISVSLTLPDGTVATSGEVPLPFNGDNTIHPVASFVITQIS